MIRGFSIRQPFTGAILSGAKNVENRTWLPHRYGLAPTGTTDDGVPKERLWVALHAGKQLYRFEDDLEDALWDILQWWPSGPANKEELELLPRGKFLGLACVSKALHISDPRLISNPWAVGPVCWVLGPVFDLEAHGMRYIEGRGRQGLWHLDASVESAMRELYRRATSGQAT